MTTLVEPDRADGPDRAPASSRVPWRRRLLVAAPAYLPALIVGFLTQYTLLFIVDQQLSGVDAIKASIKFVTDNLANTLIYYILAVIVLFVGAILCGIGLLVAAPVALIGLAYTYRRLQNQPVVP